MFGNFGKKRLQGVDLKYRTFEQDRAENRQYILGVATGKFFDYAKPFVQSARLYHPGAEVIIFCDTAISEENMEFSKALEITLVPVDKKSVTGSYHIQNSRFIQYLNLVLSTPRDSTYFLSDTRDVFFQRNIFDELKKDSIMDHDLHVFEESPETSLGDCKFNSRWLRDMFGEETMKAHSDQTIICSGTTLGNWQGMVEYLSLMIALYQAYPALRSDASDQGAHNVIIRDKLLRSSTYIHSQENELVYTYSKTDSVKLAENLTFNDTCPACVHQYDRAPDDEITVWLKSK